MTALVLGLLAAICWGFHDLAVRYISQSVTVIASLMTVLMSGAVLQLFLIAGSHGWEPMQSATLLYATISGLFYVVAGFCMYAAFQRGPVRLVAPLVASYPVLSILIAILRGSEVSLWQWLAVLAIGCGVSIVAALSSDDGDEFPPAGPTILLALTSSAGFAGTFALGQFAAEQSSESIIVLVARLTSIATLGLIALGVRRTVWPGLRALPLLCVMGALDVIALRSVIAAGGLPDAQYASVVASMFGLLTVVLAWVILKERMNLIQWIGCLIAFAGVGYLAL